MKQLLDSIHRARSIILSTHRQCDGDGLGAQLAMSFALKKLGKTVRLINVDETPKKYRFLNPDFHIAYFSEQPEVDLRADLALIFDTNDERLLEPLFQPLKAACREIAFIDHHPLLQDGPRPGGDSLVDVAAASTGELTYALIRGLGVEIDTDIAKCLYTSITFDTQLYRYIRNSPSSHRIAAELLAHPIDPEQIHRALFGNQTVQKFAFLAKTLGQIEYFCDGQLAILRIKDEDLFHYNLEPDESRDVIDMVMNIESLEAAALFREESADRYKISLRSKGHVEVLPVAESLGGGGHVHAAGASAAGTFADLKQKVVRDLTTRLSVRTP